MNTAQLLAVAGAVCFASFVQVIAGFGFALMAMPLMTLAISPSRAVVVSTLVGLCVNAWQGWTLRADGDRPVIKRMTIAAYAGMPLGLVVLTTVSDTVLRLIIGVAVLVAVVLLAVNVHLHAGPRTDLGAGFVSGVLNTSVSTNGPPIVYALQARRMEAHHFRATTTAVFALSNVFATTLFVASGKVNRDGLVAAAFAVPSLFVGQALGRPLRRHVHGPRFRLVVLVLLTLAGASAIVGALR